MQYRRLFEPGRLGRQEVKNRIWMTAHATQLVKDHLFTDEHIAYYVERAKGGVGAITMEAMASHPTTQPTKAKAFAFDPRMIPQFQKIARAVKPYGTKLFAQSWHRGRQTNSVTNGLPVWAPSAIPCALYREMPHVMTELEIAEIVEGYRMCARHAREGELDGIEVAGSAHGYLLNQFLSLATNHRSDRYGGSLENRMRIVLEILRATREEAGPDMIVGMRLNSNDGMEGGLDPEGWAEIAQRIEGSGLVDYFSCSHGTYLDRMLIFPSSPVEHGFQMPATRVVKQSVGLPVVGVGRVVTPDEAETFLDEGNCDFVGLARALIADAMWAVKAKSGRSAEIRRCIGANWCLETLFAQAPLACIYNPAAGAETTLGEGTLQPAPLSRRVAVVGGGPAGLQAALTAAMRGLDVTLFEKEPELGGQVRRWARANVAREMSFVVGFLSEQLSKTSARVELNRGVDSDDLNDFDDVIVATGSIPLRHGWTPLRPNQWRMDAVPGTDASHVLTVDDVLDPKRKLPVPGAKVVIYDSMGGREATVVADHLAEHGSNVLFVTTLSQASPALLPTRDWAKIHGMLRRKGVVFILEHELLRVTPQSVLLRDLYTRAEHTEQAEAVVLVLGSKANDGLFHALHKTERRGQWVRMIGDCVAPRRVVDAIREAELAARAIQ